MRKKGLVYIPFLMVMLLIFGFMLNSNYVSNNIEVYANYEEINDIACIPQIDEFIHQLGEYKNDYYNKIDLELIQSDLSFLDYVRENNLNLFKGNFSILDFTLGNKVNLNNDKVIFYYSTENKEGYYFYVKEYGRDINLNIARIFRV